MKSGRRLAPSAALPRTTLLLLREERDRDDDGRAAALGRGELRARRDACDAADDGAGEAAAATALAPRTSPFGPMRAVMRTDPFMFGSSARPLL
jgi:hypothetical protein